MAVDLIGGIEEITSYTGWEYILPFLLVFSVVYAILVKINLFGKQVRGVNWIIAGVTAMLLARQDTIVEFINNYLPNVSAVIIVFLMFLILLGVFKQGSGPFAGGVILILVMGSIVGGIWALAQATEDEDVGFSIPGIGEYEISEADAGALVVFGIILLVIAIASTYARKKRSGLTGFFEELSDVGNTFQR